MISASHEMEDFMKAVEKKNYLEILSFANQEATAAGRSALHHKRSDKAADEPSGQYKHALEELISFLRSAVPYRPLKIEQRLFESFVRLRQNLES